VATSIVSSDQLTVKSSSSDRQLDFLITSYLIGPCLQTDRAMVAREPMGAIMMRLRPMWKIIGEFILVSFDFILNRMSARSQRPKHLRYAKMADIEHKSRTMDPVTRRWLRSQCAERQRGRARNRLILSDHSSSGGISSSMYRISDTRSSVESLPRSISLVKCASTCMDTCS
jgi:hypothetical protein